MLRNPPRIMTARRIDPQPDCQNFFGSAGSRGITLEFHEVAGGTEIVLTHSGFPSEDARGQHDGGWAGCFDCLAAYLER